jgi:hypothetical protein
MTNLYEETLETIYNLGYTPDDIVHIGNEAYGCTWKEFVSLADFTYSSGFGSAKVATDLVIVFDDGSYLSRGEYDGSEWWEFHTTPTIPENPKSIQSLGGEGFLWVRIADINED